MIQNLLAAVSDPPHRFQTTEEYAYQHLRHLILGGGLPGGTRLNQDHLASHLQISRMPIRQAILRLEAEGLVQNRPNRGAVVTTLGPEAVLELFEIRSVLEGLALVMALPNIDSKVIGDLERRLDELEATRPEANIWVERHDDFHDTICEHARRPRLKAQVRQLRQNVAPYLRLYLSTNEDAEMPGLEHRTLLDVIKRADVSFAEQMMRNHVMSAGRGVVEFLQRYNTQGADMGLKDQT